MIRPLLSRVNGIAADSTISGSVKLFLLIDKPFRGSFRGRSLKFPQFPRHIDSNSCIMIYPRDS